MFKKLARLFGKHTLDHPTFGKIQFNKPGYWTGGACHFAPVDDLVEISVTAGTEGPSEEQAAFFRQLVERYESIRPFIAALLEEQCDIPVADTWRRLALDSLQITNHCAGRPQHWQAGYGVSDDDHVISVEFHDWIPEGVYVDG